MKKQILVLILALAASVSSPAFASLAEVGEGELIRKQMRNDNLREVFEQTKSSFEPEARGLIEDAFKNDDIYEGLIQKIKGLRVIEGRVQFDIAFYDPSQFRAVSKEQLEQRSRELIRTQRAILDLMQTAGYCIYEKK